MGATLSTVDLKPYEGLIFTTARRFASRCGYEEEDLRQELRLKAAQAVVTYDPTRSKLSLKNYVFGLLTNRVTDLVRAHMRHKALTISYIEDFDKINSGGEDADTSPFEYRYFHLSAQIVYGHIDEGYFVLPASLTEREADVLVLLLLDYSKLEVAERLKISASMVYASVERLREKLSDWRPDSQSNDRSVVRRIDDVPVAA